MKKLWILLIVLYAAGFLSGLALESHYSTQRIINARNHAEISCVREKTFMELRDMEFHSGNSLNALKTNSPGVFNLSMMELEGDLSRLSTQLSEAAIYLYPGRRPTDEEITNLTDTSPCINFVEASRAAALEGEVNVSAVEEGLQMIQSFASEWLDSGDYPSKELLNANRELQEQCRLLLPGIKEK
ncbi:hypothetical protein JCM16138_19020 [Thermococcus atlanticus]